MIDEADRDYGYDRSDKYEYGYNGGNESEYQDDYRYKGGYEPEYKQDYVYKSDYKKVLNEFARNPTSDTLSVLSQNHQ